VVNPPGHLRLHVDHRHKGSRWHLLLLLVENHLLQWWKRWLPLPSSIAFNHVAVFRACRWPRVQGPRRRIQVHVLQEEVGDASQRRKKYAQKNTLGTVTSVVWCVSGSEGGRGTVETSVRQMIEGCQ
jgi:hypothetical protein